MADEPKKQTVGVRMTDRPLFGFPVLSDAAVKGLVGLRPSKTPLGPSACFWHLNLATLEQVIEAADPIPAIAVSLQQQVMSSVFSSSAVVLGQ